MELLSRFGRRPELEARRGAPRTKPRQFGFEAVLNDWRFARLGGNSDYNREIRVSQFFEIGILDVFRMFVAYFVGRLRWPHRIAWARPRHFCFAGARGGEPAGALRRAARRRIDPLRASAGRKEGRDPLGTSLSYALAPLKSPISFSRIRWRWAGSSHSSVSSSRKPIARFRTASGMQTPSSA